MLTKTAGWQLPEAQRNLPELIKLTEQAPQMIVAAHRPVAVVMSMRSYQELQHEPSTLVEFFEQSPLGDVEFDLPREQTLADLREVVL